MNIAFIHHIYDTVSRYNVVITVCLHLF